MSYRCGICASLVEKGVALRRHTVYRHIRGARGVRQEIEAEVPVCEGCYLSLRTGFSYDDLHRRYADQRRAIQEKVHVCYLGPSSVPAGEEEGEEGDRQPPTPPTPPPAKPVRPVSLFGETVSVSEGLPTKAKAAQRKPEATQKPRTPRKPKQEASAVGQSEPVQPKATSKRVRTKRGEEKGTTPRCDLCGRPAGQGQVTPGTILCEEHAQEARNRAASRAKRSRKES